MFYFVSLYLQQVLRYEPLEAGLAYLPLAATIIVSAGAASRLVARFGLRPVLGVGLLAVAGGLAWFAQVSADGRYVVDVLPASILTALGLGLAFVPLTIGATTGVAETAAAAMQSASRVEKRAIADSKEWCWTGWGRSDVEQVLVGLVERVDAFIQWCILVLPSSLESLESAWPVASCCKQVRHSLDNPGHS